MYFLKFADCFNANEPQHFCMYSMGRPETQRRLYGTIFGAQFYLVFKMRHYIAGGGGVKYTVPESCSKFF